MYFKNHAILRILSPFIHNMFIQLLTLICSIVNTGILLMFCILWFYLLFIKLTMIGWCRVTISGDYIPMVTLSTSHRNGLKHSDPPTHRAGAVNEIKFYRFLL